MRDPYEQGALHRFLWAKKSSKGGEQTYLPLYAHLSDAAEVARLLWERWVPGNIRRQLPQKVFFFLAAAHDIGKATPVFQRKEAHPPNDALDDRLRDALTDTGLRLCIPSGNPAKARHELASHAILQSHHLPECLCVVLSGHHGKPPSVEQLREVKAYPAHLGWKTGKDVAWRQTQADFLHYALSRAGLTLEEAQQEKSLTRPQQALLSGLVILADWIASDADLFPLVDIDDNARIDAKARAEEAFDRLCLPSRWEPNAGWDDLYRCRFDREKERPVQTMALTVARSMQPGMMVIEAPMGEGKTEAALAAAEVLASAKGLRGIYFALPTQATSNAMFDRVKSWIETFDTAEEKYGIRLAHGKAELNETYRSLMKLSFRVSASDGEDDDNGSKGRKVDGEANTAFVHEWFTGRKKGMLADFTVGTIDHVLMAGLKQKHLVLRHLGLAGKVVIIDEVHAYDVYMNSYLLRALKWLGAYRVPVVALSATLPAKRRSELLNAYLDRAHQPIETSAYPLITYSQGEKIEYEEVRGEKRSYTVSVCRIGDDALADSLEDALREGGCAGVVVNTVGRAQTLYQMLCARFGAECVRLLHARLLACDRADLEGELGRLLGPPDKANERPEKLILVGTQVLEQSLDLDFDILISDLCPMDLLLQRMGRLHRHERVRPKPLREAFCWMLGAEEETPERGAEAIYGAYLLQRTRALLPERVRLPDDIPQLVADAYDEEDGERFAEARKAHQDENEKRRGSAKAFQIGSPTTERNVLTGWLDTSIRDDSEKRSEAAVRDGADSIEVIVIQRAKGAMRLLPWVKGGRTIPETTPDRELAAVLATCCVRLPALFGGEWIIDQAIQVLERAMDSFQKSWYTSSELKGTLCLVLDENLETMLCGYRLWYDRILGLQHEKEVQ